jgi:hypothetical protein
MDIADVAVATMMRAQSADEERLLVRALDVLSRAGLPVAVAERGSHPRFVERVSSLRGFRVTRTSSAGLVAQIHDSLRLARAFDTRYVVYVEPDKEAFFARDLLDFLHGAPDDADVGVVLAARSDKSFATFPPMQRYTESVINHLCADVLGVAGDFSYGPFVMTRSLARQATDLDPTLGWGWRQATFVNAWRSGHRLVHSVGEYPCPPEQRSEDHHERMHRLRQLSQNIHGLLT